MASGAISLGTGGGGGGGGGGGWVGVGWGVEGEGVGVGVMSEFGFAWVDLAGCSPLPFFLAPYFKISTLPFSGYQTKNISFLPQINSLGFTGNVTIAQCKKKCILYLIGHD